jgi:hypothetical protein
VRVRGDTQWFRPRTARYPPELRLPRVFLHAPCSGPSSPAPTTAFRNRSSTAGLFLAVGLRIP